MTWLRRLDSWWMQPLDAQPLAFFRILVGLFAVLYLVIRWPGMVSSVRFETSQFAPVGVATLASEPLAAWLVYALAAGALVTGVAFTLGWRYTITAPVFAVLLLWVLTYRNSWGQIFHTENLLVLHVIVLALVPAADALSLDARGRAEKVRNRMNYGWPLRLCALITVITYVIAGWAKVDISGLGWITNDALLNHVARDNVRKELLAGHHNPIGAWAVGQEWLFKPLAVATFVVELGAPVALLGRRIALVWAVSAWLFHVGVLALMSIPFFYPLVGLAFLPLFAWDGEPLVTAAQRLTDVLLSRFRIADWWRHLRPRPG